MIGAVNPDVDHERSDVAGRHAAALLGGIALTLIAAALILLAVFPRARHDVAKAPRQPAPPAPTLEADPDAALATFRAHERQVLTSYAWIDRDHGIVRVPIVDAMRHVAEHGIPGWPAGAR